MNPKSISILVLSVVLMAGMVSAATTISSDITTGGQLSVTGNSTFMGNVGIGTTSPYAKLSVTGDAVITGTTTLANQMMIGTNGKVRVFDNNLANLANQSEYFQILPTNSTTQSENTYAFRTFYTVNTTNDHAYANAAILGELYIPTSNAHNYTNRQHGLYGYVHHEGSGLLSNAYGSYEIAGVYGSGSITNAMGWRSHVFTDVGSTGSITNAYAGYIESNANNGSGSITNNYGLYINDQAGVGTALNYSLYVNGTAPSYFGGNILANNYIGIGSTSPFAKLSITNIGSDYSLFIEDSASPDTSPFVVDASGNVGIGTSTPRSKLQLSEAGSAVLTLHRNDGSVNANDEFGSIDFFTNDSSLTSPSVAAYIKGIAPASITTGSPYGALSFGVSSAAAVTEVMRINHNGNVGIGTTTPATRLHVSNGANATTTVSIGELGLTTSKGCVNINASDGSASSFYVNAAHQLVVEANYCR